MSKVSKPEWTDTVSGTLGTAAVFAPLWLYTVFRVFDSKLQAQPVENPTCFIHVSDPSLRPQKQGDRPITIEQTALSDLFDPPRGKIRPQALRVHPASIRPHFALGGKTDSVANDRENETLNPDQKAQKAA